MINIKSDHILKIFNSSAMNRDSVHIAENTTHFVIINDYSVSNYEYF